MDSRYEPFPPPPSGDHDGTEASSECMNLLNAKRIAKATKITAEVLSALRKIDAAQGLIGMVKILQDVLIGEYDKT